jgi:translation elongation factor EF-4
MEVIEERLEREFDLDLITTAPSVIYTENGKRQHRAYRQPLQLPEAREIETASEPVVTPLLSRLRNMSVQYGLVPDSAELSRI